MTMKVKTPGPDAPASVPEPIPANSLAKRGVSQEVLREMAATRDDGSIALHVDLDALLDADIAAWRPEAGDKLIGHIVNIEIAGQQSVFGSYPLLTIVRDTTGELVNFHAFHTVARTELGRKSVGIGDRIGVKYLGLTDGGAYGTYEDYRVVVEPKRGTKLTTELVKP